MKLGVVGTGMIAQFVVPHLGEWDWDVAAVCATPKSVDKAEALAKPYGATVYSDYAEMLEDSSVEAVYIAVPNHLHYTFSLQALEAGKHIIVEKPFASNATEAQAIAEAAKTAGLMAFEAISTLHLPNYTKLRELLDRIGDIKIVSCNYSQYSSRYNAFREGTILPAFDPAKSGGALMDLGLYNFQYIIGLFGAPKSVHYSANIECNIDTSGIATLDYGSFKAVSIAAKDCGAPTMNTIEGTKGYLVQHTPANNCGEITLHLNDGTEEHYNNNPEIQLDSEFRAFAKMLGEGNTESCYKLLDHSVTVAKAMTEARMDAGIVFPADKEA